MRVSTHSSRNARLYGALDGGRTRLQFQLSDETDELLRCISGQCAEWNVGAGRTLLHKGNVPDVCFRITSGAVALALSDASQGPRIPSVVVGARTWFGGEGVLSGEALNYSAAALTDCCLVVVRKAALQRVLREQSQALIAFVRTLKTTHEAVLRELAAARCDSVSERVRALLSKLALCAGVPAHGGLDLPIRLTQGQLALLAGATRQQVNGALQELRDEGLVDWRSGRYRLQPAIVRCGG